ncbi:MAG: hypothetical protein AVDCRST_MAG87-118, partial [uncultured Thermomicrobiales bacterium]
CWPGFCRPDLPQCGIRKRWFIAIPVTTPSARPQGTAGQLWKCPLSNSGGPLPY